MPEYTYRRMLAGSINSVNVGFMTFATGIASPDAV
jgi:hypothetical protein